MSYLMNTLDFRDIEFKWGADSRLWSMDDGRWYLDFFTDVGTASMGYHSDEQRKVLERMLDNRLPVHSPNLYGHTERNKASQRLCEMTGMNKVFWCNSGAEAAEAAIKLARKYHWDRNVNKWKIYSYKGGFHGRTYGALAAGDGPPYHYQGYDPMPDGFFKFDETSMDTIDWDSAAAIMLAPVFGNNDVKLYHDAWLIELETLCDNHDVLLIFDEVQTGAGRCGDITYAKMRKLKPDIITMAKGIGMGCPVGAVLAGPGPDETFTPGSHFSTFGGNPISMAFVNGTLDWLIGHGNLDHVNRMGDLIRTTLSKKEWAKNVRGIGMLNAFDIEVDGLEYSQACLDMGLLIGAFRRGPGPVKVTPPLNATADEIAQGLHIMELAYDKLEQPL